MKMSKEEFVAFVCTLIQTVASIVGVFITNQIGMAISIVVVIAVLVSFYSLHAKYKRLYTNVLTTRRVFTEKYVSKKITPNKLHLENAFVSYIFTDNKDNADSLDLELTYHFIGTTMVKGFDKFLMRILLSDVQEPRDITLTMQDLRRNSPLQTVTPCLDDYILNYDIPLHTTSRKETVDFQLVLDWKKYCPKHKVDTTLIDPRNYGDIIDRIHIHLENRSKDFIISPVTLFSINRKSHIHSDGIQLIEKDTSGRVYDHTINIDKRNYEAVFGLVFHDQIS